MKDNLKINRYSSNYQPNSRGEYRGVEYEIQHMGLKWRLRSKLGQFYGDSSGEAISQFKRVVDSGAGW